MLTKAEALDVAHRLSAVCFELDAAGETIPAAVLSLAIERLLDNYPDVRLELSWPTPDTGLQ